MLTLNIKSYMGLLHGAGPTPTDLTAIFTDKKQNIEEIIHILIYINTKYDLKVGYIKLYKRLNNVALV